MQRAISHECSPVLGRWRAMTLALLGRCMQSSSPLRIRQVQSPFGVLPGCADALKLR
jgi:hypothetical protein